MTEAIMIEATMIGAIGAKALKPIRPRFAAPGLTAALATTLALGGCAGTHVGDAWQCPLAQGAACASVAAADPAVNETADTPDFATRALRYRERSAVRIQAGTVLSAKPASDCAKGCSPFAWIAGLFAANADATVTGNDNAAPSKLSHAIASPASAEDNLRTPETIGRIWIAPFADGDGVYHEARWVRVVIKPAGWRRR